MKALNLISYVIKYVLWGSLAGLLVLFFMPDSKLSFNWQSAREAWQFYQSRSKLNNDGSLLNIHSIEDISFAGAVEKAFPSVVSINVFRPKGLRKSDQLASNEKILDIGVGIGSGIILSNRGYIVTNYHVIAKADQISINLADDRKRLVELVGYDIETDIAVLRTDLHDLKPAILASSMGVKVGDLVMAIGSPFGRNQSVSLGIISAINVDGFDPFAPLIQTDAAINSGNSGGALINLQGEVIGINQKILSSRGGGQTGLNYAIPIDRVKKIVDDIILYGRVRRNWLGIITGEFSTEYHHKQTFPNIEFGSGFFVSNVDPESPALRAGIKIGDFIIRYQKHSLSGVASFYKLFYDTPIGKDVEMELIRDGKLINVSIQLVERPQQTDP